MQIAAFHDHDGDGDGDGNRNKEDGPGLLRCSGGERWTLTGQDRLAGVTWGLHEAHARLRC